MSYDGLPSYGSMGANDQLVPVFTASSLFPTQAQAPTFSGGLKSPPTLAYPTGLQQVGYPLNSDGGTMTQTSSAAASDPFNPRKSPVLWAIGFLLIGIIGLRKIHFQAIDR
jgi:hypothetical protein